MEAGNKQDIQGRDIQGQGIGEKSARAENRRESQSHGSRTPQGQSSEVQDRVVNIGRVVKVVKGGRRFSFNALVVSGDGAGTVGYGLGKASEVPAAISKAASAARSNMMKVSMTESGTLPFPINSKYSASKVMMLPAKKGAGLIAGGCVRAVMELAGFQDAVTKCHGSSNPHNLLKAVFKGLQHLSSKDDVWVRRGLERPIESSSTQETDGVNTTVEMDAIPETSGTEV